MHDNTIALWRLYLLRAAYLLIAAGMGSQIIPVFLAGGPWEFSEGVVNAMLLALVLLSVIGLRYPLTMLPVLFWEMAWKAIWLLSVALPQSLEPGGMDAATTETAFACALAIVIAAATPWDFVWRQYVKAAGERWF